MDYLHYTRHIRNGASKGGVTNPRNPTNSMHRLYVTSPQPVPSAAQTKSARGPWQQPERSRDSLEQSSNECNQLLLSVDEHHAHIHHVGVCQPCAQQIA